MQNIKLDDWQLIARDFPGNICLCTGRQIGKSTVISERAALSALDNPKTNILIIAAVERQALLLFEKVHAYLYYNHKKMIKKGKDRPTKHKLSLTNGSTIHCLPTGQTGHGIRGYTINDLYADEAHFIPEDVWSAVTPMLATTGGRINLLSTPDLTKGKSGYFYVCSMDEDFKFLSISTEDVAKIRDEPQRSAMLKHIEFEKKRLSKAQFAAEYMGEFIDGMFRFFPDDWIEKVCVQDPKLQRNFDYAVLGVDIAGMGEDKSAFESLARVGNKVIQIGHQTTTNTRTTETEARILQLDDGVHYRKIGIDTGGMGIGVFDRLLINDQTKRKIVSLNNASRDIEEKRRVKLLKESMYYNILAMGERGELTLWNNDEIKAALRSVTIDPEEKGFKIMGHSEDIMEALTRAAQLTKGKSLNPWISSFSV